MLRLKISLRTKIILLISGALGLSAISTVFLGANLIVQDKTSYIYDYNSSQVGMLAAKLESSFRPLTKVDVWPKSAETLNHFADAVGLERIQESIQPVLGSNQNFTFTISEDGKKLHLWTKTASGSLASFAGSDLDVESEAISKEFSLCIVQPKTKQVLYHLERPGFKQFSSCEEASKQLQTGFEKGARELTLNSHRFIVSYQSILNGSLLLMSVIPSEVAFLSARNLVRRSTILELSLFFLIIGIVLLLVRTVVSRINELTEATREVSSGNFDLRLSKLKSNDEVGLLANSFSVMSQKIKELLVQTEQKVRMEKELETAQMIQQKFLPHDVFVDGPIRIYGQSRPASECGGDLWQAAKLGERVIFLFGDITGHGLSAALLTASIYGAFVSTTLQLKESEKTNYLNADEILRTYGTAIHESIESIAHGEATFPSILVLFDHATKRMSVLNSAHPAPYFWVETEGRWKALLAKVAIPLGETEWVNNEITSVDLSAGIDLFFYTDGLFDNRQPDQAKLNKKEVLALLANNPRSDQLVEDTMAMALHFFGPEPQARPDDITLVQIKWRVS
jgi:serine phosphatase RsbU (regulator of sigma subunit)